MVRIGIFGLDNFSSGREKIVDERLNTIKEMAHSAKKAYIEVELITEFERLSECNGIISIKERKLDLIITDLEFIDKRLSNCQDEGERKLLNRFKEQLENEHFLSGLQLNNEEGGISSSYSLLTMRPIFLVDQNDLEDKLKILLSAYAYFGYICFFTANEKEARAWPIKIGLNCWQASGLVHSDIQQGFIRAEVIGFNDLVNDGGINQARANNHMALQGKEYIVQDGDLIKFRFNK